MTQALVSTTPTCSSATTDIDRRQTIIEELVDRLTTPSGPDHGLPAGLPCSEYLDASRDLLGYDGEAHEQAVIERFGAYTIPFVIDIGSFCLFSTRPARPCPFTHRRST
ncbi:hypothetical protein ACKI1I_22950 [Streptomyces turgidiscabies]|uniref:hypothetical protein n=1 Tax=Streptomyces TaxID=1883 RepID=UPI0011812A78|nr:MULTISPECIES: hypothetical protein [Streptomyces]MDX3496720.1 hypothetical protein [Streptomyces turgidiscabies]